MKSINDIKIIITNIENEININKNILIKENLKGKLFVYKEWLNNLEELPKNYKVNIIESERDYGSKIDDVMYFRTEEEAKTFVKEFNSKNNKIKVPDWYMYADYKGFKS